MSRMFDRLLESKPANWPSGKADYFKEMVSKAIVVISADNCAQYFYDHYAEDSVTDDCFMNCAPPFDGPFWIEYREPRAIFQKRNHAYGALITTHEPERPESKWTLKIRMFCEPEKGEVRVMASRVLHIAPDGSLVPARERYDGIGLSLESRDEPKYSPKGDVEAIGRFFDGRHVNVTSDDTIRQLAAVIPGDIAYDPGEKPMSPDDEALFKMIATITNIQSYPIGFALSLMHCKNIELRPVDPIPALSRKHERKRGRPLVRYHELVIEPMKAVLKREGQIEKVGLTRAMGIVRGHFKDFTQGKGLFGKYKGVYWWPQKARGDHEQGIVLKDYKVLGPQS